MESSRHSLKLLPSVQQALHQPGPRILGRKPLDLVLKKQRKQTRARLGTAVFGGFTTKGTRMHLSRVPALPLSASDISFCPGYWLEVFSCPLLSEETFRFAHFQGWSENTLSKKETQENYYHALGQILLLNLSSTLLNAKVLSSYF